jgi:outer membrane murein-binding lipoprotein Lpp
MSSRSLAAARARRAGDPVPPVSGNRPVTSIGSQAAFAQQLPSNMNYNMPPPPNNVRTAKGLQQPMSKPVPQQYQQFYDQQQQQQHQANSLPFQKLSISDAIGLITLRLGRVEQWIIETDHEEETKTANSSDFSGIPDNHKVIDNSVLTSIINRLNSLEKNTTGTSSEENNKLSEDIKTLNEQFKRMSDDVSKHTIEIAKNTEQVFRFNRELTETKDILKSFMVKYDMFSQEITQNFTDYENAIADLEKRMNLNSEEQPEDTLENMDDTTQIKNDENNDDIDDIDENDNDIIVSGDLKKMIKQEFANSK